MAEPRIRFDALPARASRPGLDFIRNVFGGCVPAYGSCTASYMCCSGSVPVCTNGVCQPEATKQYF